jgi:hypothetical protein
MEEGVRRVAKGRGRDVEVSGGRECRGRREGITKGGADLVSERYTGTRAWYRKNKFLPSNAGQGFGRFGHTSFIHEGHFFCVGGADHSGKFVTSIIRYDMGIISDSFFHNFLDPFVRIKILIFLQFFDSLLRIFFPEMSFGIRVWGKMMHF